MRGGMLVSFQILEENKKLFTEINSSSPLSMNVSCGFVIHDLYYIERDLFAFLLESFYHKWMLNFINSLFFIYWKDHMIFILQFVNVVYYTYWFMDIEKFLHFGINSTWSWHITLLMNCWIQFASISLRIFASMLFNDIGL